MNSSIPPNTTPIPLAYPGITVESIPGTSNIYEVVWNCGSISALMTTLSDDRVRTKSFSLLASILDEIRQKHKKIIFITDEKIFQENPLIETLFKEIFGPENYRFIFTQKSQPVKNTLSGLRVNRSEILSIRNVVDTLTDLPDAPVVSSIPYSDPRIDALLDLHIARGGDENTLALQSLKLLRLNSKKSNQQKVAADAMGFLGTADDTESLRKIFGENLDVPLVLKEDDGAAGGTTVNFVLGKDQREKVIAQNKNFPILIHRFFPPTLLENSQRHSFPLQMRPYFTLSGRFAGGCLKVPQRPLKSTTGFVEGSGRGSFQTQNETLNTSSGLTQSFFFDENGKWISGFRSMGEILDPKEITQIFAEFRVDGEIISSELLLRWALGNQVLTRDIQMKTCSLLGILNS